MDIKTAMPLFLEWVDRRGQNRVAEELGISSGTITKWRGKTRPAGKLREKVIAIAEQELANRPPAPDVLTAAVIATGANAARLAEIRAYAQIVLEQLEEAARRQHQVVASLKPWADAEGRQMVLRRLAESQDDEQTARERSELDAVATTPPTPAKTRRRASGRE
jgi:hypothetical protein